MYLLLLMAWPINKRVHPTDPERSCLMTLAKSSWKVAQRNVKQSTETKDILSTMSKVTCQGRNGMSVVKPASESGQPLRPAF